MLIQRWMHAGYDCHNLIGDFTPAVRPGERQSLKFQHLHSALSSLQALILHGLECQSHLLSIYLNFKQCYRESAHFSHLIQINVSAAQPGKPHFIIIM